MIKVIKLGDSIYNGIEYNGIEEKTIDKKGNETWNIPTDLDKLKKAAIDTINWIAGDRIKKAVQNNITLLNASNSKAIVLLGKIINSLNPDLSKLTDNEKNAFDNMVTLGKNGYADSKLLNTMIDSVTSNITSLPQKITDVQNANSIDEIIKILNSL